MEAAFAAGKVDLSIVGDWVDAQIALGLLAQRLTPPNYGVEDEFFTPGQPIPSATRRNRRSKQSGRRRWRGSRGRGTGGSVEEGRSRYFGVMGFVTHTVTHTVAHSDRILVGFLFKGRLDACFLGRHSKSSHQVQNREKMARNFVFLIWYYNFSFR